MFCQHVDVGISGSGPTCTHRHGCASYHPHGSHAIVAGSRYRDGGGVEGCGGDAVRLHHGGVMDHMWLSRIHWLSVVRSLPGGTRDSWVRVNMSEIHQVLFNGSLRGRFSNSVDTQQQETEDTQLTNITSWQLPSSFLLMLFSDNFTIKDKMLTCQMSQTEPLLIKSVVSLVCPTRRGITESKPTINVFKL